MTWWSNDILTPDERDALLEGVASRPGVEPDPSGLRARAGKSRPTSSLPKINLAPGRAAERSSRYMNDSHVDLGTSLFQLIRRPTQVTAGDVQTLSYCGVCRRPARQPRPLTLVGMAPLGGYRLLHSGCAHSSFALVESFFGGAGRDTGAATGSRVHSYRATCGETSPRPGVC